ncbi:HAD family hydrolase [Nocardioides guangzhouensis]|uniref:HAD family hydrolase n=1 Tax=Nocardioides guangzhouensis TaxID=2497878 RepID=A0A4Q4ZDJ1_9ACTN|nr:HAD family hydrolase [Nocardioides guangzhouensis]RYP86082.1 HAD family hydrolase [Nocardioides guangzhouensis]
MTVRVAMWSGPRNISTAMMRAWENRPDCTVVDEPFYAAYLVRTGLDHPGRDAVVASQPTDAEAVVAALQAPTGSPVHYAKHMTHHLADDMDLGWVTGFRNVLLIRDPAEVVASYVRSRESCEPQDIGLLQQERLMDAFPEGTPVIDAGDFLHDPEAHLRWLCGWLDIDFTDRMLHWPAGPRDSDGVWAPYWYAAVQQSTGFQPWRPREIDLSPHDTAVAETCRPAYDALHERRLRL